MKSREAFALFGHLTERNNAHLLRLMEVSRRSLPPNTLLLIMSGRADLKDISAYVHLSLDAFSVYANLSPLCCRKWNEKKRMGDKWGNEQQIALQRQVAQIREGIAFVCMQTGSSTPDTVQ